MPRFLLRLFLTPPVLRFARWLADKLDALLVADFEARFVAGKEPGAREKRLEDAMRRTFRVATAEEKQRFLACVEDVSREDQHTLEYAEAVFAAQRSSIEEHRGSLEGARILELGPGHSIAAGLLLFAHGAERYVGADFFPIAGRRSELYRRLRKHLAERPALVPQPDLARARAEALRRFDAACDLSGDEARFMEEKVAWRHPVDAAKLPFADGSFDVVISNAAFEHFLDPRAAARESARVLAPDGVGIHQVDLRDHRDFSRPLDFLRYEEAEWKRLNADMVCYTNRLRRRDLEAAFKEAGLELALARTTEEASVSAELRASLHADFKQRDDLETLGLFLVVRKPR